ncbi:hypothetical protein BZG36_05201 [Bifiguratus adelaidae]|uniref:25S rRNA (uridine-N(3))-methyltransferase BMT5-like domain-containing protein n=1 Tax=Bifiguratus adelaidae TaxID=1938954 RepID=A0A261XUH8_9FUNG|nr:hypothetical protein BZG36_05201 [Bifiguratus adelaidae]
MSQDFSDDDPMDDLQDMDTPSIDTSLTRPMTAQHLSPNTPTAEDMPTLGGNPVKDGFGTTVPGNKDRDGRYAKQHLEKMVHQQYFKVGRLVPTDEYIVVVDARIMQNTTFVFAEREDIGQDLSRYSSFRIAAQDLDEALCLTVIVGNRSFLEFEGEPVDGVWLIFTAAALAGCVSSAPKPSVPAKYVFAHIVVGDTFAHTQSTWQDDITLAHEVGIDAFVLNIATPDSNTAPQVANAFAAAKALNNGLKLFFSFDYLGGGQPWPATGNNSVVSYLTQYKDSGVYFYYEGQPFASTFEGTSNINDWAPGGPIRSSVGDVYFVPDWTSLGPSGVASHSANIQGAFSWDMWPVGANDMTDAPDMAWVSALGSNKTYMMGVSPCFFHSTTGGTDWVWRGDDLWPERWQQVLVTWNDFGEASYIGPIHTNNEIPAGSTEYVMNMPHDGWREFLPYYIAMYKQKNFAISHDQMQYWYRTAPAAGGSTCGVIGNNPSYQTAMSPNSIVQDKVFFSALLKSAATVKVQIGNYPPVLYNGVRGINHWSQPFNNQTGPVTFSVIRNGHKKYKEDALSNVRLREMVEPREAEKAVVTNAAALAQGVSAGYVFAHVVVGNTAAHTQSTWQNDITLAHNAGIDAFALNIATPDSNTAPQVANAFAAAKALNNGFKLFFSFDYLGGGQPWPATGSNSVVSYLTQYKNSGVYFYYNGLPFASTFEGTNNINDWAPGGPIRSGAGDVYFVPDWTSLGPSGVASHSANIQGAFSWDMWPAGANDMTTTPDQQWVSALAGKSYMMGVSPWFFHSASGGTDWVWRGDDLWAQRWQQVLQINPAFVEIVTWNDFAESHYIGPVYTTSEIAAGSSTYVNNMPHESWRDFLPYYIAMYKKSTFNISRDQMQYWYRTAPAAGGSTCGVVGNNPGWQTTMSPNSIVQDKVFFSALLMSPATVTVQIGNYAAVSYNGVQGINHWSQPFNGQTGSVKFSVVRNGATVKSGTGVAITASTTLSNGCTNYNAQSGLRSPPDSNAYKILHVVSFHGKDYSQKSYINQTRLLTDPKLLYRAAGLAPFSFLAMGKLKSSLVRLLDSTQKQKKAKRSENGVKKTAAATLKPAKVPVPFRPSNTCLLIGEGNFSFARSLLANVLQSPSSFIATCFDSEQVLYTKYEEAKENVEWLRQHEGEVLFEVDGTMLEKVKAIKSKRFERIVFQFPHAGAGIKDQTRNINTNRTLLHDFFVSATPFLTSRSRFNDETDGEIHVTIKSGEPYSLWEIKSLAKATGELAIKATIPFHVESYPGYAHRRTLGFKEGLSKESNEEIMHKSPKTYIFVRKEVMEGELEKIALLLVDPLNDYISPNGKMWPQFKAIAEEVKMLSNLKKLLEALVYPRILVGMRPDDRQASLGTTTTMIKDATASKERYGAAVNVCWKIYAHAVMSTAEWIAALNPITRALQYRAI